jgi:predicted ribosomally synthesized peptide with SipW-like signal peptide
MKNILLSVVVIGVLIAAGVGGTFAHFSDTEESVGNQIKVGAMDLKVNGYDDPDVGAVWEVELEPGQDIPEAYLTLSNVGQPAGDDCHVYIHFKNFNCENIDVDGNPANGVQNPEPEDVAQDGGWLGQVYLPGIGILGDNCNLAAYIVVTNLEYDGDPVDLTEYDVELGNDDGVITLNELLCHNILLGELDKADSAVLGIDIDVNDIDEDDILTFAGVDNDGDGDVDEDGRTEGVDGLPGVDDDGDGYVDEDPGYEGDDVNDDGGYFNGFDETVALMCWDHWPTNALMKDKITFDLLFSLVEGPYPGEY